MNEKLTNGLHDELWINGARTLIAIGQTLETANDIANRANAIACLKEIYAIGQISKDNYEKTLVELIKQSGYNLKIEK